MIVVLVERVTPGLRGYLTRWLIQIHPGVFVGHVSTRIREALWQDVQRMVRTGGATMLWSDHSCAQSFRSSQAGRPARRLRDFEGLLLPETPKNG